MKSATFQAPGKIIYGDGALEQAGAEASAFGEKAFVITGKNSARRSGLLDKLLANLEVAGMQAAVFAGVDPDPGVETIARAVEEANKWGSRVIVALGGGSALDAAKAVSIMLTNPGTIADYEHKAPSLPGVPVLAIPTTAGTGSEVSRYTVITDRARQVKMLIGSPHLIPKIAILDPLLTLGMPPAVTAATGMDALTHAIEAYISTAAQPATDLQALSAIRLIGGSLVKATVSGDNLEARGNMLLAQMQAGLAFSNSSVALVHALARPLGARLGVPHGLANAILLPTVMEFNRPSCPERLTDVAAALGEPIDGLSLRKSSTRAVRAMAELLRETGLPGTLSQVGVTGEIIPLLARDAIQSGSVLFNPRRPTEEEIADLYRLAL